MDEILLPHRVTREGQGGVEASGFNVSKSTVLVSPYYS